MVKIRRLQQWFLKYIIIIYSVTAAFLAVIDFYVAFQYCIPNDTSKIAIVIKITALASSAVCIFVGFTLLRRILLGKFLFNLEQTSKEIYFHGYELKRYLDSSAIIRLENWLKAGLCYELSVLAMMLVKDNKSARICRGDFYDKDGKLKTKHAWVEVKVPLNGWFAIDLAWFSPCFGRRKDYFKRCNEDGKLIRKWVYPHDKFWGIQFSNVILEAIKCRETSCILLELTAFGGPEHGYGFMDWIQKIDKLRFSDGSIMLPHTRAEADRPISTRVIRDFVKKPTRRSPKSKSIRIAKKEIRAYERWRARQEANQKTRTAPS